MFLSRLFSSTITSSQTAFNNSSLPTRRLPRLTRAHSVSNAFSESATRSPSHNRRRSETFKRNLSNSYTSLFSLDIRGFKKESENLQEIRKILRIVFVIVLRTRPRFQTFRRK